MNKKELATYLRGVIELYVESLDVPEDEEAILFEVSDEIITDGLDNAWYLAPMSNKENQHGT